MRPKANFSLSRQGNDRRKAPWIIVGTLAILLIVFVTFPSALDTGSHPSQDHNTTTSTTPLSDIQMTYEAVYSEYTVALAFDDAIIATAAAQMATQEERLRTDANTYSYNESGNGCSGNPAYLDSCLSNEQETAQSALGDENAATRAEKVDVTKQIGSVHQIEDAITAFVQQLDGIPWPSSVSLVPLSVTQALSESRGTYAQVAIDLASGKAISVDSEAIAATQSAVATQLSHLASALGIPPPSSPTTS